LLAFAIPIEHKYDKLFRYYSLKLIPQGVELPSFFDKKIYFYPSDLIAIALLAIALIALRVPISRFFLERGAGYLWALFLIAFLSILFSPLAHYPIPYVRLLQLLTPILLFSFLANAGDMEGQPKISTWIVGCLIAAASIQSLFAIFQYAVQGPLGLRLIGENAHFSQFGISSARTWIFDPVIHETCPVNRSSGTLPHANVLGGFLCVSLLTLYPLFFKPLWRLLGALLVPLQFFAMSLTFSRSAVYAWALATLAWFGLLFARKGFSWQDRSVRWLSLSLFFSIAFSFIILREPLTHRGGFLNYNQLARRSDENRIRFQNIALSMVRDYPWLGAGFQQYSIRSFDYAEGGGDNPGNGTHNIYLYLAAETGILSLAAFLLFLFKILRFSLFRAAGLEQISLTAALMALLLIGLCDFYPLLFQQGKLTFFLIAGLLASSIPQEKKLTIEAA